MMGCYWSVFRLCEIVISLAELGVFLGGVLAFLWLVQGFLRSSLELPMLLKALLLSSYGKLLLIPAVIWEHDYSPLCFSLIKLFVLTSNSQAIRGMLQCPPSVPALCLADSSSSCILVN